MRPSSRPTRRIGPKSWRRSTPGPRRPARRSRPESGPVEAFVDEYAGAGAAVLLWSMGITQHRDCGRRRAGHREPRPRPRQRRPRRRRADADPRPLRRAGRRRDGRLRHRVPRRPRPSTTRNAARARRAVGLRRARPRPGSPRPRWSRRPSAASSTCCGCRGGNFLDVLPDPPRVEAALGRVPLRVHQDIVLISQMLVPRRRRDPAAGGAPATSRRAAAPRRRPSAASSSRPRSRARSARPAASGGCSPTSPRRVRPDLAARSLAGQPGAAGRDRRRGAALRRHRDAGRRPATACSGAGGTCAPAATSPRPTGGPRSRPLVPPAPSTCPTAQFTVATRRGKQFNSMVLRRRPTRSPAPAATRSTSTRPTRPRLGVAEGDRVVLRSATGSTTGRVKLRAAPRRNAAGALARGQRAVAGRRRSPRARLAGARLQRGGHARESRDRLSAAVTP